MKFTKIAFVGMLLSLCLPMVSAHALQNKVKALNSQMHQCEAKAKKYSSLGYPAKAEKQLKSCTKIQRQIASIKKGQAKVSRKIASLNSKSKKKHGKKHAKKKHKKKHVQSSDIQ